MKDYGQRQWREKIYKDSLVYNPVLYSYASKFKRGSAIVSWFELSYKEYLNMFWNFIDPWKGEVLNMIQI